MTGGVVLATCWESFDLVLVSCPAPTGHETSLESDMSAVPAEVIGEAWGDEASGNLLQTFWDLYSLGSRRLQAARKLVSGLLKEMPGTSSTHAYVY